GGDHAPAVVVGGALLACQADPALDLLLVGPRDTADEILRAVDPLHRGRVTVRVPVDGETSVHTAVRAVLDGAADAVVSAGSTGATVRAAVRGLGRWPGVRRPALVATLPTVSGRVLLLDAGATVDPSAAALVGYACLGAAYAAVHDVVAPRVGLLSIGTESGKGDRVRRAAAPLLAELCLPAAGRYVGLVEGHEVVLGGHADVVVTDGFTGNVLLKGIEAAHALAPGQLSADLPPRAAALLGVAGTVVVCHGAATARDLASGIALAVRLHRHAAVAATAELFDQPASLDCPAPLDQPASLDQSADSFDQAHPGGSGGPAPGISEHEVSS
ncbi:MAG TPA: phosphate acyltransferase, partial [Actinoplanes sp.]|nr:phosphate acyltransferase [Actinoplanes sp.]